MLNCIQVAGQRMGTFWNIDSLMCFIVEGYRAFQKVICKPQFGVRNR